MPDSSASPVASAPAPPVLATVWRDGVVESVHRGAVVVASPDGKTRAALGDAERPTYVRSAAKPLQAVAVLEVLAAAGWHAAELDSRALAIACASHLGEDLQQIEAARLLALADLDESALRCPPAVPAASPWLRPDRLAHNCSGKHGAFLLATVAAGESPSRYLEPGARVQRQVRDTLADVSGCDPSGPGVDGCGAPAWVLPLRGLAVAFARLAAAAGTTAGAERASKPDRSGGERLARVGAAMRRHPLLVGGVGCDDSELMVGDPAVVAKRGAEGVFAVGWHDPFRGPLGLAVKVEDGGDRTAGPAAAAVLSACGAAVRERLRRPVVLGGGVPHGRLEPVAELGVLLAG